MSIPVPNLKTSEINNAAVNFSKVNLFNFSRTQLETFFEEWGEKKYRATQIMQWLYHAGITDVSLMTNLSQALREKLQNSIVLDLPEIHYHQVSKDGTQKWVLRFEDGNSIETVFIPEETRGTLCISSQVGCMLTCTFCSTAKQGFNRNLTTAEIISQLFVVNRELKKTYPNTQRIISNIVLMGMGEPLLNFDNVLPALEIMLDDMGYGLAKRRVTLSTAGVVPMIERLAAMSSVSLAVSLHAPRNDLRDILVPINKKYPLEMLMAVCRNYFSLESGRQVTFEYVMLEGVNDSLTEAKQLSELLRGIPAKINLIPFNPFPGAPYRCSSPERLSAFRQYLLEAGYNTITRKTRGQDIAAACGQLVGLVVDRTKRSQRWNSQLSAEAVEQDN